jgi:hypothetical protein
MQPVFLDNQISLKPQSAAASHSTVSCTFAGRLGLWVETASTTLSDSQPSSCPDETADAS